jgi:hypothetical protein
MTKEDIPVTPRPADPFTAQDGARLFTLIDTMTKRISSTLEEQSNRLAIMQRNDIKILELLQLIEAESSDSRLKRLELEIEEAERERKVAEENLRAIESKISQKQNIKDQNQDTGDKYKAAAASALSDIEKRRKDESAAFLLDLKRSIIKAVLVSLSVGAVTGTIAFIWWLFQLYLNRGGP